MAPLYELLRKDTPWKGGKEQSKAFKQCKTLLHCDSLLVHYDPSKQLVLACDASTKGVGCVLSHLIDGVERPIAFYSRTLKPADKNYSVLDKEALAVICGVKKFHCYLYGRSPDIIPTLAQCWFNVVHYDGPWPAYNLGPV